MADQDERAALGKHARTVAAAVEAGAFPLVTGGDCTVTIGVLDGLAQSMPLRGLLYFDADVDLRVTLRKHRALAGRRKTERVRCARWATKPTLA